MRITAAGNVGIGTSTPSYKLEVNGNVYGSTTAQFGTGYIDGTQSGWAIFGSNSSSNGIKIVLDGSILRNDIVIATSGLIGIGTGAPTERLHVSGNLRVTGAYYDSNNSAGTSGQVLSSTATGTDWVSLSEITGVDGTGTTNYVPKWLDANTITDSLLYDNGTTVSIGLGATTPSYTSAYGYPQFAIESNAFASSHVFTHNSTNGNYSFFALGKSKGTAAAPTIVENSETIGDFQFWAYDGAAYRNTAFIRNQIDGTPGAGDTPGRLVFGTTNDGSSSATEKMRITSGGDVGIGTSSPQTKLHVNGDLTINTTLLFSGTNLYPRVSRSSNDLYFSTNASSEVMRIVDAGNVGIGTSAPGYKLHVVTSAVAGRQNMSDINRTSANWVRFTNPQYSADASMGLILRVFPDSDARQGAGIIASGGNNNACTNLDLFVTSSPDGLGGTSYSAININGLSGNVGIGTTSPIGKLDIYQSANPALFIRDDSSVIRILPFGGITYFQTATSLTTGSTTDLYFSGMYGTNVNMVIKAGGNVLLGTTVDEGYKLDVRGDIRAYTASTGDNNSIFEGNGSFLKIKGRASYAALIIDATGTNNWEWGVRGETVLRLKRNGSDILSISPGGESTFSSSVTSTGLIVNGQEIYMAPANYASGGFARLLGRNSSTGRIEGMSAADVQAFIGLSGYISGSGTTNYVPKFTGASSIGDSTIYDDGTNVGIGTTTPNPFSWASKTLTVASSVTNSYAALEAYGNGTGAGAVLLGNTSILRASIVANDGSNLVFAVNASNTGSSQTERMRITASGYIGVASSSPVTRFTVNSYAGSRLPYINGTANTFDANGITVTSSNTANANIGGGLDLTNNVHSIGSYSPLISFSALTQSGTYNNNYAAIYGVLAGDSGDGNWNTGHIAFATTTAYGTSEKVRITSAGNVGIGTTNPSYKLVVNGAEAGLYVNGAEVAPYTQKIAVFRYGGNGNSVNIENQAGKAAIQGRVDSGAVMDLILNAAGGSVGIGTGSPAYKLTVNESATDAIAYFGTAPLNASSRNALIILQSGTIPQSGSDTTGEVGFLFKHSYGTGGVNGTANGGYIESIRESVFGITSQVNTALVFGTSSANIDGERMRITSTGNVGIGTSAPAVKLDVVGTINGVGEIAVKQSGSSALSLYRANSGYQAVTHYWEGAGLYWAAGMGYSTYNWVINDTNYGVNNKFVVTQGTTWGVGIGASEPLARLHVGANLSDLSSHIFPNTGAIIASIGVDQTAARTNVLSLLRDGTSGVVYGGLAAFDMSRWQADGVNTRVQLDLRLSNTDTADIVDVMSWRSNGYVGIGTTAPAYKLDVNGDARFIFRNSSNEIMDLLLSTEVAASKSKLSLLWYGNETASLKFTRGANSTGGSLEFWTQPEFGSIAQRMTVASSGNVGINTTAPVYRLHVEGSVGINGTTIPITNNTYALGGGSNKWSQIWGARYFADDGSAGAPSYSFAGDQDTGFWKPGDGALATSVNGVERMRIDGSGYVGIGTSAPSRTLTLVGTSRHERVYGYGNNVISVPNSTSFGTVWIHLGTCSPFTTDKIYYRVNTNTSEEEGEITISNTCALPFIQWQRNTYNPNIVQVRARMQYGCGPCEIWVEMRYGTAFGGANTTLQWQSYNGTDYNFTTVNAIGTPGTGTNEKSIVGSEGYFYANSGSITVADRIGIGTTTPSYLLDVVAPSGGSLATIRANNGYTGAADGSQLLLGNSANFVNAYFRLNGGGNTSQAGIGSLNIGVYEAVPMAFYTFDVERMRIAANGNVGIGTSAPGYKLEVNGGATGNNIARFTTGGGGGGTRGMTIYSNDSYVKLQVTDNAGSASTWAHLVLNPDGGYVGIGTTAPAYSLDVNGIGRVLSSSIVQASSNSDTPNVTFTNNGGSFTWGTIGGLLQGDGDGALYFNTKLGASVTEKMRITSTGNVGIGISNPSYLLHVGGRGYFFATNQDAGWGMLTLDYGNGTNSNIYAIQFKEGGSVNAALGFASYGSTSAADLKFYVNNGSSLNVAMIINSASATTFSSSVTATGFFESSDARLKTIVNENYRLDSIVSIKPKFYEKNGKFEVGYIAQEVEQLYPHAVTVGADGYLSLSYSQVHTLKLAYLEDSIEEIKRKIAYLEQQLNNK
jgi:hypothetical protein